MPWLAIQSFWNQERIVDEIDKHPEMFKPRAVFSIDADPIWAALQDIQQDIMGDSSA